jgi:PAS domain S-box-containing protein
MVLTRVHYGRSSSVNPSGKRAVNTPLDRWNAIFEAAPNCIKLMSGDGHVLDMNQAGLQLLGTASRDDVLGRNAYQFVVPEHHDRFRRALESVCAGGRERWEFEIVALDGARKWMDSSAVPLYDAASGRTIALVMTSDITDKKRGDERLRQLHFQLSHVARVSAMGEMASEIAHELNQPLTAVIAYTDACLDLLHQGATDPSRLEEILRAASMQADRAGKIIHRLRNFVRRAGPSSDGADVNAAAREIALLFDTENRTRQAHLMLDLQEPAPRARADFLSVQQVILNLLRNALDAVMAVPVDRRRITITTRVRDGGVEVAVSDSGCGIPPELADRVFEPFFSTKPEGLGLGLSISRSIAEFHGGRLELSYNPDGGVTFRFWLLLQDEGASHATTDRIHRG